MVELFYECGGIEVIEAKRDDEPPDKGLEQAKKYARLNHVPFVYSSNGHLFVEYYQDAAIRAALENIARGKRRLLLYLATGSGKTFIAVHLLKKIADAGQLRRALFLCDRDELRTQGLAAFQHVFGADAAEVTTSNPQNFH